MHADDNDELLSYGSPRRSFSVTPTDKSTVAAGANGNADDSNIQSLLAFYRQRCEQFQQERQTMLDQLARVEVSKEEFHRLKWELRAKHDEVSELEASLQQANATLFDTQRALEAARADRTRLQAQEAVDRQKIEHLLALTQPVIEEVTLTRDRRPATSTSFPVTSYASTMHIASEPGVQTRRHRSASQTQTQAQTQTQRTSTKQHILRTVYLPNAQATLLQATVESLQTQLAALERLTDERIHTLQQNALKDKSTLVQRCDTLTERTQSLESQLRKSEKLLLESTRTYLVLKHQTQETERLAHEEIATLQQRCLHVENERCSVQQQAAADAQALRRTLQTESSDLATEARSVAIARERDLQMLKAQYAAVQDTWTRRLQDLQLRLATVRDKYKTLAKRRTMEMEGFSRDVTALKRQLETVEALQYGRQMTMQERQRRRRDAHQTLASDDLSAEVAALRDRVHALAQDVSASAS